MLTKIKESILVLFFYLASVLVFLRGIVFSRGMIFSGDWSFPLTFLQMSRYAIDGLYRWTDRSVFGVQQYFISDLWFRLLTGLAGNLGINGEIWAKLFLIFVFVFAGLSMYWLLRFLGCGKLAATLGGFFYFTLPVFFNYSVMGWLLVLLSMGILPIAVVFFIKSFQEKNLFYSLLVGFLWVLAMAQSQSLFWYPLIFVFLILIVKDRAELKYYLKSFLIIFVVFLFLTPSVYLPIIFKVSGNLLGSSLGLSAVSLGTWGRLYALNILRGWGGLYNYSYEAAYPVFLIPLSFLLPVLAILSLIFLKDKKIIYPFWLISFITAGLFSLGPAVVARLPMSDIIRDVSRFTVISSFCFVVLAILVLDFLLKNKKKNFRVGGIVACILILVNAFVFWSGGLFGKEVQGQDIRLRNYIFSSGDVALENYLAESPEDFKILYLPAGGAMRIFDDQRFTGTYNSMRDIFSGFPAKPGDTGISDRDMGSGRDLVIKIKTSEEAGEFNFWPRLLGLVDVKYLAVRDYAVFSNFITQVGQTNGAEVAGKLAEVDGFSLWQKWPGITLIKNNYYLSHIYPVHNIILSSQETSVDNILAMVLGPSYSQGFSFYFKENLGLFEKVQSSDSWSVSAAGNFGPTIEYGPLQPLPKIEFKKINQTKYRVVVRNARGAFPLTFSENFHQGWRCYAVPNSNTGSTMADYDFLGVAQNDQLTNGKIWETWPIIGSQLYQISESNHFMANGYANSWWLDATAICGDGQLCQQNPDGSYDFELVLEFWPQRWSYLGYFISLLFIFVLVVVLIMSYIYGFYKKRY